MTNIQAFILAFVVLTIQTITLIVSGFMFGVPAVMAAFWLFVIVDVCLCAVASDLKVVKKS